MVETIINNLVIAESWNDCMNQHLVTNRPVHCKEETLSGDSTATACTQWLLN